MKNPPAVYIGTCWKVLVEIMLLFSKPKKGHPTGDFTIFRRFFALLVGLDCFIEICMLFVSSPLSSPDFR